MKVSRLQCKTAFYVLHERCWGHLQRGTKAKQHPNARAVAAELDQGHIVAICVRLKGQPLLAPLALDSQAAQRLPECLIYVHTAAQDIEQRVVGRP